MKRAVKIAIAAVLALSVGGGAVYTMTAPVEVEAVTLAAETAQVTFTEQGYYVYTNTYQVYPLIAGEVLEVAVEKGDFVEAGDVIAVVSASDYEYQIAQMQGTVGGYSAQIDHLALQDQQEKDVLRGTLSELEGQKVALEAQWDNEDSLDESRNAQIVWQQNTVRQYARLVDDCKDELKWIEDLYDAGEVSYAEYNAAQQALASAKSAYYSAQVALDQLRAGGTPEGVYTGQMQALDGQIDAVNLRLDNNYTGAMVRYYQSQIQSTNAMIAQLQEKRGQGTVTATVSGVIDELPVQDANLISQQIPVAVIGSDPLVEVYVPIREIDGVAVGDTVELVLDKRLGNETIAGKVALVEDKAEVKYSALGVEERKVRVLVEPQDSGLLLGYEMDVKFSVYTQQDALVVPKTAVFQRDGQDFVWVLLEGQAVAQPIEKGVETRDGYVVEEGLSPGQQVVKDADNGALSDGKKAKMA